MIGYTISYDNNLEENCSLTSEKVVKKTKEYWSDKKDQTLLNHVDKSV